MTDNNNDRAPDPGDLGFDLDKGFRLGDIEVLPRQSTIVREGESHRVEPRAMEVLVCLAKRNGDTVTRGEFEAEVWPGKVVETGNLDGQIAAARKALGDTENPRKIIFTHQGIGYRLIVDVTPLVDEAPPVEPAPSMWRGVAIAAAAVVVAATGVAYFGIWGPGDPPLPPTTISVQCFDNLSDAPESEYFAEGLAEEIRAALSRVNGIHVVSRTSSQSLCESGLPISEIGERLGAGSVLEGSVRRVENQVKISVQLSTASDDRVLLSQNYDGALADIFELQNRIATDIAHQMSATLTPGEQLVVAPTADLEAYQLYLRAHFQLRRRGVEPVQRAIELFREAIARDPEYGRAYQGLAEAFALTPAYTGVPPVPLMEMSLAALDKAEALGGTDSHAHAVRGFIHLYQRDWEAARAEFDIALLGEPNNSDLLQWYSQFLATLGYIDLALDVTRRSVEEDPLSPVAHQRLGVMLLWNDDLEGSEEQYRIATEELGLEPTANPRTMIGLMLRRGQYDEVRAVGEMILSATGSPIDWVDPWLDYVRGEGAAGPALEALGAAYESGTLDGRLYVDAMYYLDDADALFGAIDLVYRAGTQMDHEIWFVEEGRVLQQDPRFPGLLQRIGIIDYWDAHGWPKGCVRVGDLINCERSPDAAAQVTAEDPPVS